MKRTDTVTARIPIAADPMLGPGLVWELTAPLSLSTGAFPWDAEPAGRGKRVGNWLHRRFVLGRQGIYARLHHHYVIFDDLDHETWPLVGRATSLRAALQKAEVVKAGHLDEPALLATLNATLWDVAQRCARLTSLRRARQRADAYDTGGLLPAQTVRQTSEVLAKARAALDSPMDNLEELAWHVLEADDHYRAWKALQELSGRSDDFADLAVAEAVDPHHAAAWGGHFAQARATAATLAASISAARSFLEDHGLATAE
ncbi:hypothetical protein OG496_00455 [Streptomyces sp. NBC_00988]|uniref:hypothetical protein n=1 Tax=Streptomyces sp. NBC_00988 TaxID=2903704 RepID=UPI003870D194|nr:hypothetical protein OG496_00455 [Streptomyces sp. NBC_00988]